MTRRRPLFVAGAVAMLAAAGIGQTDLVQRAELRTLDVRFAVRGPEPVSGLAVVAIDEDTFNELTAGVNYYMSGHAAKLTVDVTYLPDGSPTNETGIGFLDPDADSDQFVLRGQFQLLI